MTEWRMMPPDVCLHLRIPELTDGETAFPDGELANHSYWLIRLLR